MNAVQCSWAVSKDFQCNSLNHRAPSRTSDGDTKAVHNIKNTFERKILLTLYIKEHSETLLHGNKSAKTHPMINRYISIESKKHIYYVASNPTLHCILGAPFSSSIVMFLTVRFIEGGDFRHQWVIWVGVS